MGCKLKNDHKDIRIKILIINAISKAGVIDEE